MEVGVRDLPASRLAVLQDVDLRGRRRDPLVRDRRADERVDERALAGVELADDDEEEQFVELLDRLLERGLVIAERHRTGRARLQPRKDLSLFAEQLILGVDRIFASMQLEHARNRRASTPQTRRSVHREDAARPGQRPLWSADPAPLQSVCGAWFSTSQP